MAQTSDFRSTEWHSKITHNYQDLWRGDLSLLDKTLSPQIKFNADRFPSSTGQGSYETHITTKEEFGTFIQRASQGFSTYGFDFEYWFGQDLRIAIRWYLVGVVEGTDRLPTNLAPGSKITYNGTDILHLNSETGLVDRIDSAQDLITLFHNLGMKSVPV